VKVFGAQNIRFSLQLFVAVKIIYVDIQGKDFPGMHPYLHKLSYVYYYPVLIYIYPENSAYTFSARREEYLSMETTPQGGILLLVEVFGFLL
jgi:hypothetical protein